VRVGGVEGDLVDFQYGHSRSVCLCG
jgi:hypothetical protein